MAKYFKNVTSYEDLKKQYKELLKANHPDNGGDENVMKEINIDYEALFPVWKSREEAKTGEKVNETAASTQTHFYHEYVWKGDNHDWNRSLKEVAQIVRAYVKEKYPTYKFSVRTAYASMCKELLVELKESPIEIYKTVDEFTEKDKSKFWRKAINNHVWTLDCWNNDEFKKEYERIIKEEGNFYKILNETTTAVINDVDRFVQSYNFEDIDSMTDYFHVDFYYSSCGENNGMNIKVVPKTARIKDTKKQPKKAHKTTNNQNQPEAIKQKNSYTYTITKGTDTRDGSDLWIVRITEALNKDEYIAENKAMKSRGAYYSKFLHGFLFRVDPSEILKNA